MIDKPKLIISSAYAAIITIVFIVVITILAELFAPLKDWLKNFSGHHWVSKSFFSALLFVVVTTVAYLSQRKYSKDCFGKTFGFLLAATALGIIAIAAFFTAHYFRVFY